MKNWNVWVLLFSLGCCAFCIFNNHRVEKIIEEREKILKADTLTLDSICYERSGQLYDFDDPHIKCRNITKADWHNPILKSEFDGEGGLGYWMRYASIYYRQRIEWCKADPSGHCEIDSMGNILRCPQVKIKAWIADQKLKGLRYK